MNTRRVRKAIIPAAGMGTRFLPATKSMPKEMLPIIDKPVLQYVIEEAIESGIEDILIVTGRGKRAIENHFDYAPELEAFLVQANKREWLEQIRDIGEQAHIFYIRQKVQRGLGDAIRLGRYHMGDEPFAVLLGDTIIHPADGSRPGLRQLLDVFEEKQASVVAVQRVRHDWVNRYGIVAGRPESAREELVRLDRLVEKPPADRAPSNLAIAGRYVFTPGIFVVLEETTEGVGGEIQLTDAMNALAQREPMYALEWRAQRYDIGDRVEYAKCFLDFALRRADTRDAILEHLRQHLSHLPEST
jgi:UTP--glucose-1-phosphate uridylyltransferase